MSVPSLDPEERQRELEASRLGEVAQAILAVRSTVDLGTSCSLAAACAVRAMGADEVRVLRLDPRSGALRVVEASGVEVPYLAEEGGPVERVLRHETAYYDEGASPRSREALLWTAPPAAMAALPLFSGPTLLGCLLLGFTARRRFEADDRLLLQTLADAMALGLQRAELRRVADEERARRIEFERRLHSDEESSSSLMSLVAHEIRTPLTAIKAYTETLLDTLGNPHAPRDRFLGIINDECDRLARLVTDILDLSRLEAGQRPLRLARIEFEGLAREVVESLDPIAAVRRIDVQIDVEPGLVVEGDPDLLRRLFVNLVSNGVKFSPIGEAVTVRVRATGEEWRAEVEDAGPGISPEDLPHVFERFFRSSRPADKQVDGSGLGLAISRGIVELHGGRIWVESPPGRGSRFCIALPLRQMASARARRIARHVMGRADLSVLFERTVEMVARVMDAGIVSFMLVDPDRGDLFIVASRGLEGNKLALRRTPVRSGVAGSVAAWGRPVLVNNIETDRRFRRLNHPQYSTKSLLSAPILVEAEVLGVVNVNNKTTGEAFDENDLALLAALVERVGSAIERAHAHPESARIVEEACGALDGIARLKGEGLLGSRSLVGLARELAREMDLGPSEVDGIGYVAAIRDLGMTSLNDRLMAIPGPLGEDERRAVSRHPELGVEMIRPIEYQGSVREIILSHHERWDGSGYPRGLAGHEIPLGARILSVVDAYDSMTSGRPYRAPMSVEEALAELRREAGRQFDPEVVEGFARALGMGQVAA